MTMEFKNVNTYHRMLLEGSTGLFHSLYEKELHNFQGVIRSAVPEHANIINGQRITPRSYFEDRSPIDTGIIIGRFPKASREDVNAAVDAASDAFRSWSLTPLHDRLKVFEKVAVLMEQAKFQMAAALTYDNGKDRQEAVAEVDEAIDFVRFYTKAMAQENGFDQETNRPYEDERVRSVMRPYGVWAVICPFNFPSAISCGMMTGAMITGNTVVVKPSSPAPLAPYMLYDLYEMAGLPAGVMNVLCGSGAEVGDTLVKHPRVSGVVFTGSRDVGNGIIANAAKRQSMPVIAEMGGKNAAIVMDSADLDKAATGVARSAFLFSGQKCSACSRVYVHEKVMDRFLDIMSIILEDIVVTDPRLRNAFTGPVIHEKAMMDYKRYLDMANEDGKVMGGRPVTVPECPNGHYVSPAVAMGLPSDHFLVRNELFLPILCALPVRNLEDAVRQANYVDFGLTAGIFSKRQDELQYFFDHIEAGVCYANRQRGATTGAMVGCQPFGGWKGSGSTGKGTGTELYLTQFLRQQARTFSV